MRNGIGLKAKKIRKNKGCQVYVVLQKFILGRIWNSAHARLNESHLKATTALLHIMIYWSVPNLAIQKSWGCVEPICALERN